MPRGRDATDSVGMETWITELTPLSFLERSAEVHPDKVAVVYGPDRWTYRELAQRVQRAGRRPARRRRRSRRPGGLPAAERARDARRALRGAARGRGARGDQHPAVRRGGPLHLRPLRGRAPRGRRRVRADRRARGRRRWRRCARSSPSSTRTARRAGEPIPGPIAYARPAGRRGRPATTLPWTVDDERATISINYTSGTTGRPKGVMYTHRGAYLNALGEAAALRAQPTTASTCGRCRCSTATAGARRGRWSRSAAPRCACARCAATRSGS